MVGRIDYLQNLSVERRPWRTQVRVIRLWKQPTCNKDSGNGDYLEMFIIDQQVRNYNFKFRRPLPPFAFFLEFFFDEMDFFSLFCDGGGFAPNIQVNYRF